MITISLLPQNSVNPMQQLFCLKAVAAKGSVNQAASTLSFVRVCHRQIGLLCRQKGLLAISCLIRNNAVGTHSFLVEDGIDWLLRLLREDKSQIQRQLPRTSYNSYACELVLPVF